MSEAAIQAAECVCVNCNKRRADVCDHFMDEMFIDAAFADRTETALKLRDVLHEIRIFVMSGIRNGQS